MQTHPQKFLFVKNVSKILENLGKTFENLGKKTGKLGEIWANIFRTPKNLLAPTPMNC